MNPVSDPFSVDAPVYVALYMGGLDPHKEVRGIGYARKRLDFMRASTDGWKLQYANADPIVWDGEMGDWSGAVTHVGIVTDAGRILDGAELTIPKLVCASDDASFDVGDLVATTTPKETAQINNESFEWATPEFSFKTIYYVDGEGRELPMEGGAVLEEKPPFRMSDANYGSLMASIRKEMERPFPRQFMRTAVDPAFDQIPVSVWYDDEGDVCNCPVCRNRRAKQEENLEDTALEALQAAREAKERELAAAKERNAERRAVEYRPDCTCPECKAHRAAMNRGTLAGPSEESTAEDSESPLRYGIGSIPGSAEWFKEREEEEGASFNASELRYTAPEYPELPPRPAEDTPAWLGRIFADIRRALAGE